MGLRRAACACAIVCYRTKMVPTGSSVVGSRDMDAKMATQPVTGAAKLRNNVSLPLDTS